MFFSLVMFDRNQVEKHKLSFASSRLFARDVLNLKTEFTVVEISKRRQNNARITTIVLSIYSFRVIQIRLEIFL